MSKRAKHEHYAVGYPGDGGLSNPCNVQRAKQLFKTVGDGARIYRLVDCTDEVLAAKKATEGKR